MIVSLFSSVEILIRSVHETATCASGFVNGREKACISVLKEANRSPDDTTGVPKAALRALSAANGTLSVSFRSQKAANRTPVGAKGVLFVTDWLLFDANGVSIASNRIPADVSEL
jgi:hypothetical protein